MHEMHYKTDYLSILLEESYEEIATSTIANCDVINRTTEGCYIPDSNLLIRLSNRLLFGIPNSPIYIL